MLHVVVAAAVGAAAPVDAVAAVVAVGSRVVAAAVVVGAPQQPPCYRPIADGIDIDWAAVVAEV